MKALTAEFWKKEKLLLCALTATGMIGATFVFPADYFSNINVLIGLCLFPFALFITGPTRNNVLYVFLMMAFLSLAFVYQVRIFYFFSLVFYFLWLLEILAGRLNVIVVFLAVFMSPVFIQVVTILGFPIRLLLSDYAGVLLNAAGVPVQIEGNLMTLDGAMFSVDEACMGLNMLVMSSLMGVFVLVFRYHLSKTTLGFFGTSVFFAAAFVLNLVTNLIRIIVLVIFHISPENPMHELIGILCLLVYVVVPLHFLGKWLVMKYGHQKNEMRPHRLTSYTARASMLIFAAVILLVAVTFEEKGHEANAPYADIRFGNMEPDRLTNGISKISTDDLLIYVKTIPEFFTGEHTPLMCWRGSGYEFSGISTTIVQGKVIYKGRLVKDGKLLHTAWWYSNGEVETISQFDWRVRMLKGESKFCLVNVTAENEETLLSSLQSMFAKDLLKIRSL